jgi:hypothetical protein
VWRTPQAASSHGQHSQALPRHHAGAPGEADYASGAASTGSDPPGGVPTSPGDVTGDQPHTGDAPAQFDGRWALDVAGTGPQPQPARNSPPDAQPPAGPHAGVAAIVGAAVGGGSAKIDQPEPEQSGGAVAKIGLPSAHEEARAPAERGMGAAMGATGWLGTPPPPAVPTSAWEVGEVAIERSGSGGEKAMEAEGGGGEEATGREAEDDALLRPPAEPVEMSEGEAAAWAAADAAMADAARAEAEGTRPAGQVPPSWPPSWPST